MFAQGCCLDDKTADYLDSVLKRDARSKNRKWLMTDGFTIREWLHYCTRGKYEKLIKSLHHAIFPKKLPYIFP
jgi:hypothetical protein